MKNYDIFRGGLFKFFIYIVTDTVGQVEVFLWEVILFWPSRDRSKICCGWLISAEFWNLSKERNN